jgi:hypothetical protein
MPACPDFVEPPDKLLLSDEITLEKNNNDSG